MSADDQDSGLYREKKKKKDGSSGDDQGAENIPLQVHRPSTQSAAIDIINGDMEIDTHIAASRTRYVDAKANCNRILLYLLLILVGILFFMVIWFRYDLDHPHHPPPVNNESKTDPKGTTPVNPSPTPAPTPIDAPTPPPPPPSNTCAYYCAIAKEDCIGDNQLEFLDSCEADCQQSLESRPGTVDDAVGDSLACRIYQITMAGGHRRRGGAAAVFCLNGAIRPNAGTPCAPIIAIPDPPAPTPTPIDFPTPTPGDDGGDLPIPTPTPATNMTTFNTTVSCESYCELAEVECIDDNAYSFTTGCIPDCLDLVSGRPGDYGDDSGDTLACRITQLQLASLHSQNGGAIAVYCMYGELQPEVNSPCGTGVAPAPTPTPTTDIPAPTPTPANSDLQPIIRNPLPDAFVYGRHLCEIWCEGDLLSQIQMSGYWDDPKHFPDAELRVTKPEMIINWANINGTEAGPVNLVKFIQKNFADDHEDMTEYVPLDHSGRPGLLNSILDPDFKTFANDLNDMWLGKIRRTSPNLLQLPSLSSLLPLQYAFAANEGRWGREMYYGDTYWAVRGLLTASMVETARGMVHNILQMIEEFGFVPMANRKYYMSRSGPPTSALMVWEIAQYSMSHSASTEAHAFLKSSVQFLEREYSWWQTHRNVTFTRPAIAADGDRPALPEVTVTLNQWRHAATYGPRAEQYQEDMNIASTRNQTEEMKIYSCLFAASESGWDITESYLSDVTDVSSCYIDDVIPVDLNTYLLKFELTMANIYRTLKDRNGQSKFENLAIQRAVDLTALLYDATTLRWRDYRMSTQSMGRTDVVTNYFPLWSGIHTISDVAKSYNWLAIAQELKMSSLVHVGGLSFSGRPDGTGDALPPPTPTPTPVIAARRRLLQEDEPTPTPTPTPDDIPPPDTPTPTPPPPVDDPDVNVAGWQYPAVSPVATQIVSEGLAMIGQEMLIEDITDLAQSLASTFVHAAYFGYQAKHQLYQAYHAENSGSPTSVITRAYASRQIQEYKPSTNNGWLSTLSVSMLMLKSYGERLRLMMEPPCQIWCGENILDLIENASQGSVDTFQGRKFVHMPLKYSKMAEMLTKVTNPTPDPQDPLSAEPVLIRDTSNIMLDVKAMKAAAEVDKTPEGIQKFITEWFDSDLKLTVPFILQGHLRTPPLLASLKKGDDDLFRALNEVWKSFGVMTSEVVKESPAISTQLVLKRPYLLQRRSEPTFMTWGTYAQVKGLLASHHWTTARNVIENQLDLVERYGYVPQGAAMHHLGRAAPPLLAACVQAYLDWVTVNEPASDIREFRRRALPILHKEYTWWMTHRSVNVVYAKDEKSAPENYIMNRYAASSKSHTLRETRAIGYENLQINTPRPEMYWSDELLTDEIIRRSDGKLTEANRGEIYGDILAASESGWGFSSRWLNDRNHTYTLHTSGIVPVCLNAYLFRMENILSELYRGENDRSKAGEMMNAAMLRLQGMNTLMWNENTHQWHDYNIETFQPGPINVLSNFLPMWAKAYSGIGEQEASKLVGSLMISDLYLHDNDDSVISSILPIMTADDAKLDPSVFTMLLEGLFETPGDAGRDIGLSISRAWLNYVNINNVFPDTPSQNFGSDDWTAANNGAAVFALDQIWRYENPAIPSPLAPASPDDPATPTPVST